MRNLEEFIKYCRDEKTATLAKDGVTHLELKEALMLADLQLFAEAIQGSLNEIKDSLPRKHNPETGPM